MKHIWLEDCDWEKLLMKAEQAPYTLVRESIEIDVIGALRKKQKLYKVVNKIIKSKTANQEWDLDF